MIKDYLGNELNVGDRVIFAREKYFQKAVIVEIYRASPHYREDIKLVSDGNTRPALTYSNRLILLKDEFTV
jgi:hypothetical protein